VFELKVPAIGPLDLLVKIKAVSVNPVDYKVRASRAGSQDMPVILGWDAAGVVVAIGGDVRGFRVGDEVFYAGDLTRQGSNAQKMNEMSVLHIVLNCEVHTLVELTLIQVALRLKLRAVFLRDL
jgi:NADPH:quinone reductase-like Zn-dependent oxidoreductase